MESIGIYKVLNKPSVSQTNKDKGHKYTVVEEVYY